MARVKRRSALQRLREERADVAGTAQRLAVLLQAGVAPTAAWAQLDQGSAKAIADRIRAGQPAPEAIATAGESWRELAAAWRVAVAVGAPLADALRSFASGMRDAVDTIDDVAVALAEPAGTARLMLWLPAAGVLLGVALGFDTARILLTDPRGIACLVVGLGLIGGAHLWTRALVRRANPPAAVPGAGAELLAIALSGGSSIDNARGLVADAGAAAGSLDGTDAVLELSRRVGVPAVELLRAEAAEQRRRARTDGRSTAARLGSRLVIPLGVCTLPAFLILGVAPLLLSILDSTGVSFL